MARTHNEGFVLFPEQMMFFYMIYCKFTQTSFKPLLAHLLLCMCVLMCIKELTFKHNLVFHSIFIIHRKNFQVNSNQSYGQAMHMLTAYLELHEHRQV